MGDRNRLQALKMKGSQEESRNSWINKHEPTDVSNMTLYKDGFEDILEQRRHSSDFNYAAKPRRDVPQYKYQKPRTPEELKLHVLQSDRVNYATEKLANDKQIPLEKVKKEAEEILVELGHNFSMRSVRCFAYVLVKVFKALFRRVYVNEEGVQMLRKMIHEYPVLLMPTHRSYMDFLLVSYIFYQYDLPLPAIAAAMDFSNMKFVGGLLQRCGAFYIRRSFGTDQLYWAIFTEYVQTQLRNGDCPVEFFIEGTRSRTSKSYQPRIGMLSASLESYFKAELPDVMIVPISISYERILEESLYAYELLGIPKPKESTSGLFKARSILSEDFGSVHFYISQPVSIRQFSMGKIDRVIHALEPRYINNLTDSERELTKNLAFELVRIQQRHLVISPWSLMAAVLMQSREGITVKQLIKETEWLKRQGVNNGGYVDWPGNASAESVVRHYLGLHLNIVTLKDDLVLLKFIKAPHVKKPVQDEVMLNAATNLILASYRNQLLHVFIRPGLISLCVNGWSKDALTLEELYKGYVFLEKLFCQDFVFQPGETRKDFNHALLNLQHSGGLTIVNDVLLVKKSINKHTTFLSQMFEPFLLGYWVLCQHLLSLPGDVHGRPLPKKPKLIAVDAQRLAIRLLQENIIKHYEILSLDLLGNGLLALTNMKGVMYKDKRNEETWVSPNNVLISNILNDIGKYVEVPAVSISQYTTAGKAVVITAKL